MFVYFFLYHIWWIKMNIFHLRKQCVTVWHLSMQWTHTHSVWHQYWCRCQISYLKCRDNCYQLPRLLASAIYTASAWNSCNRCGKTAADLLLRWWTMRSRLSSSMHAALTARFLSDDCGRPFYTRSRRRPPGTYSLRLFIFIFSLQLWSQRRVSSDQRMQDVCRTGAILCIAGLVVGQFILFPRNRCEVLWGGYVRIPVLSHVSKTTRPNFTKL